MKDMNAFSAAIIARRVILDRLHEDGTSLYRLFNGATEGQPGLTIDRYGPNLLFQSWRDAPSIDEVRRIHALLQELLGLDLGVCFYDRSKRGALKRPLVEPAAQEMIGKELGLQFHVDLEHRGIDPLLFLDFRAARRRVRSDARGKSVLNLFSYTCGIGVAALAGGAESVCNVDFAEHALSIGRKNAELNDLSPERFEILKEDCIPVMRQFAGLGVKGRAAKRRFIKLQPRQFDFVVLDPPRYAKSPFGLVDTVNDYQSLFKPALLATKPGGQMLVTNNVASVALEDWLALLKRAAEKAGRLVSHIDVVSPEDDFPSFDGSHPLKMALLDIAD